MTAVMSVVACTSVKTSTEAGGLCVGVGGGAKGDCGV